MNRQRAFTLIELLMVISIIGLLSSVVLGSLNSARTKAQYAANQELDANFNHALADSLVGQWLFDEGSAPAKDTSGYNDDGLAWGSSPAWSSLTPSSKGFSLDARNGGIAVGDNPVLIPKKFTVSAWVYVTAYNADHSRLVEKGGHSETGGYGIEFDADPSSGSGVHTVYGVIWDSGNPQRIAPPDNSIGLNKWYFVMLSFDGSTGRFYINGVKRAEVSGLTMSTVVGLPGFYIGTTYYHEKIFPGYIDSVRVYDRALDVAEIQKLYAEGLAKYQMLADK